MNSFELTSIVYDADIKNLTFKFDDNSTRICTGIETVDDAVEEITKIIKKISA